jgi:2-amino-4-hydroxy-6-hydroxymethyldihydropteridine diphosphokinase
LVVRVILSLGTNLGDRAANMAAMVGHIRELLSPPITFSSLMETEPVGVPTVQPWYLNRLVMGGFAGSARELLERCRDIENGLGRERPSPLAARTADVDILLYGERIVNEPDLIVPHLRMLSRRFCLEGLRELDGERVIPGVGMSVDACWRSMPQEVRHQQVRRVALTQSSSN